MTKAARARRRRAEREELATLRTLALKAKHGGVHVQRWALSDIDHAKLDLAARLGCTLVMRNGGEKNWSVYAVKE